MEGARRGRFAPPLPGNGRLSLQFNLGNARQLLGLLGDWHTLCRCRGPQMSAGNYSSCCARGDVRFPVWGAQREPCPPPLSAPHPRAGAGSPGLDKTQRGHRLQRGNTDHRRRKIPQEGEGGQREGGHERARTQRGSPRRPPQLSGQGPLLAANCPKCF